MKRWIHANTDYDRLKYVKNGEVEYLPTWYLDKSDEEVEKAKNILINAPEGQYTEFHEIKIPNEAKLRRDLKEEGFIKPEIEEIIEYIYSGGTVDAAIQRQLDLRGSTNAGASAVYSGHCGNIKSQIKADQESEPTYKFVVYELDDNGEELDSISAFDSEEEAIAEAERLINEGQIAQAHVVVVPNEDPDDDPEIAEWYEYECEYEPYAAVWSSI